jgi:hypothetical protein
MCEKMGTTYPMTGSVFGAYADPTKWLGRKFTKYEAFLMEGPSPVCYSFTHVTIGEHDFRTAASDRNKSTMHSYFRTFFEEEERDNNGNLLLNEEGQVLTQETDR